MYSNQQNDQSIFINNPRSRNTPQQQSSSYHSHSFGPMAINPSHTVSTGSIPFTNPSANWFGTSMDSNASSFGQSPVFGGRELLVTPSTSTGHLIEGFGGGDEDGDLTQRNHQEIFEKRRRRRESHNAVERRRRDNINERIQELSTLLPDHLLESVPASANVMTVTTGQSGTNGKPINKGTILKLSVDHIKELREEVSSCKTKIQELEQLIELAKRNKDNSMRNRHVRASSIQFQQQFGNLHINGEEQQQA